MRERSIFLDAVERSDLAERAAYLDEACAGDPALRERVEALLRSHEEAGSFLEKPALDGGDQGSRDETRTGPGREEGGLPADFLAPSSKPGSLGRLGHYEVQEVIGRGGMGVVLRAFDESLHRVVAVKAMAPQLATNATARKRFTREAHAAAAVRDEHVTGIYAVAEANGLPYLVMEYVKGMSLQERLDLGGPLELKEILRIGMQTAAGLAAAHAQGLVHRDIKPANILLENGVQRVKLTDFGLARVVDDASLTQSGVITGTPQYMAPEQALGEAVDHRADLFSLGSVLYACCTGHPPFRASTTMAVLKRVCEETPRPIQEVNPEIPDWLCDIIAKLHAKKPADRFQSAKEVADLLGQHLAHLQQPGQLPPPRALRPPAKKPSRVRRLRRVGLAALVVLFVLAALYFGPTLGRFVQIGTGVVTLRANDPDVRIQLAREGTVVAQLDGTEERRRVSLPAGRYEAEVLTPPTKVVQRVALDGPHPWLPMGSGVILGSVRNFAVVLDPGGKVDIRIFTSAAPPPTQPAPAADGPPAAGDPARPFLVLPIQGGSRQECRTLGEAVAAAKSGDTIYISGNGPFPLFHLHLTKALTLRASCGSRPVLTRDPRENPAAALFETDLPLALEGLEINWPGEDKGGSGRVIRTHNALSVANCRFRMGSGCCIDSWFHPRLEIRNCEFLCGGVAVGCQEPTAGRLVMDNCVVAGNCAVSFGMLQPEDKQISPPLCSVVLSHNTFLTTAALDLQFDHRKIAFPEGRGGPNLLPIKATENAFDVDWVLYAHGDPQALPSRAEIGDYMEYYKRVLSWQFFSTAEYRNAYRSRSPFRLAYVEGGQPMPLDMDQWTARWGEGAITGPFVYKGGDVRAKLKNHPEQVVPEDFRQAPNSAGSGLHAEWGGDRGAEVDLIGPGAAYEKWIATPAYQEWRKAAGQAR